MKDIFKLLVSAMMAGMMISIGCIVNISAGMGIAGAVLFTFGLISVVHYKYSLYTGTAGFVYDYKDILRLFLVVLTGNILGCFITSQAACIYNPSILDSCNSIVSIRMDMSYMQVLIRGVFCGILMTTAVMFARRDRWLPLLFAVPVFILSGMLHSIADGFYILSSQYYADMWDRWLLEVAGNFIGCNIYRISSN